MIVHERTRLGDMFGIGSMTPRGIVYSQKPDEWGTDTASDYPIGQVSAGVRFLDIPDSIQLGRFAGGSSQSRQFKTPWPPWATAYARKGGILRVLPPDVSVETLGAPPLPVLGLSGCCAGCVGGNHCEGGLGDIPWPFPGIPMWPALIVGGYLAYRVFLGTKRVASSAASAGRAIGGRVKRHRRRRQMIDAAYSAPGFFG